MKIRTYRQKSVGLLPLYLNFILLRYDLPEMEHTAKILQELF